MNSEELKELEAKVRRDNKSYAIKKYLLASLVMLLIYFGYNVAMGNYKFLGRETAITEAIVSSTKMRYIGKGYYKQMVKYQFSIEGQVYTGEFLAGQIEGRHTIGQQIEVKYAVDSPEINEQKE